MLSFWIFESEVDLSPQLHPRCFGTGCVEPPVVFLRVFRKVILSDCIDMLYLVGCFVVKGIKILTSLCGCG